MAAIVGSDTHSTCAVTGPVTGTAAWTAIGSAFTSGLIDALDELPRRGSQSPGSLAARDAGGLGVLILRAP